MVLDGHSSSPANVTSGVPQGSILGPLLFILYMDSINNVTLSPNSKLLLYADDILLYSPIQQPSDFATFQSDVDLLSQWVCQSGLRLNAARPSLCCFPGNTVPHPCTSLTPDGTPTPKSIPLNISESPSPKTYPGQNTSILFVWMPSVGLVFCIGSSILRVLHASHNFTNPLFFQSSTTAPVSGTLIQHSTQTNLNLYRIVLQKSSQSNGTLTTMIA